MKTKREIRMGPANRAGFLRVLTECFAPEAEVAVMHRPQRKPVHVSTTRRDLMFWKNHKFSACCKLIALSAALCFDSTPPALEVAGSSSGWTAMFQKCDVVLGQYWKQAEENTAL